MHAYRVTDGGRNLKTISCLIVDDEEPARLEMRRLLSLHPQINILGEASDVDAAIQITTRLKPDVVFLDVTLRGETGFDYVARAEEPLPHLVFVTAHDRYAIRGFECNAIDYLLKPIRAERLADTLERLRNRAPVHVPATDTDDTIFLKIGSCVRFVPWNEIHHVVTDGNYTRTHFMDGTSELILKPLKDWLRLAPKDGFLQIHRTTLINRKSLQEVRFFPDGRREFLLSDGSVVAVGRSFLPRIKSILNSR
ncbi:MAG: response regulator [Chthoniobacterales bacterium]